MQYNLSKKNRAFTLIEIMVATSIFMIIMLVAMGALITSSDTAKKAQAMRIALDSVNYAMEGMTRYLRTGSDFYCTNDIPNLNPRTTNDCLSGGTAIVFTPANDPQDPHPPGSQGYTYFWVQRAGNDGSHTIDNQQYVEIIPPNVDIEKLTFYVKGSSPTDKVQPSVYILVKGSVTVKGEKTPFAIQSMASQRSAE